MDWHNHFNTIFFETWQKAGLPHQQNFLPAYYKILEQYDFKNDWIKQSPKISAGIDHTQLYAVYGFGVTVGNFFGEMLGLNEKLTENSSDWCGRFNLGISLYDYICDEGDGVNRVSSLKVFKPFIKAGYTDTHPLTVAEELLSNLAGSVLNDVKKVAAKKEGLHKTDLLFKLMKQLFEAQDFVSKQRLCANADLDKIKKALYFKSAEPFRVMAEYTARMADANDGSLIKKARSIGKAIGYCYWLIDDAKDVWIDLEAQQWNLFLLLAAKKEPEVFAQERDVFTDSRLLSIWEQSNHAQKISNQVIKRLVHAVARLELSKKTEQNTLGLVAASLWQWYHY